MKDINRLLKSLWIFALLALVLGPPQGVAQVTYLGPADRSGQYAQFGLTKKFNDRVEKEAQECFDSSTPVPCFDGLLAATARKSRQEYRSALTHVDPLFRSAVNQVCPGQSIEASFCAKYALEMLLEDTSTALRDLDQHPPKDVQAALMRDKMSLGILIEKQCRPFSDSCFRKELDKLAGKIHAARKHMGVFTQKVAKYSILTRHCMQKFSADICTEGDRYLYPLMEDSIPYNPRAVPKPSGDSAGTGKATAAGTGNGTGEKGDFLSACISSFDDTPHADQFDDHFCKHSSDIKNAFSKEVELIRNIGKLSALRYFAHLREEAYRRFLESYYRVLGQIPSPTPPSCRAFPEILSEFKKNAPLNPSQGTEPSPELDQAAGQIEQWSTEARNLSKVWGTAYLVDSVNYKRIQQRIGQLESMILQRLDDYPTLAAAHPPRLRVFEEGGLPYLRPLTDSKYSYREKKQILEKAQKIVARDLTATMEKFCNSNPDTGGASWTDLIQIEALTSSALYKNPVYQGFHDCALKRLEKRDNFIANNKIFITAGCAVGTVITEGLLALACTPALVGVAGQDYLQAREKQAWVNRCRAGGGSVCNETEWKKAYDEFNAASSELALAVATAPLDALGGVKAVKIFSRANFRNSAIKLLRESAEVLSPAEMLEFSAKLRTAHTVEEMDTALQALRARTSQTSVRKIGSGAVTRVSADADLATDPVLFQKASKKLEKLVGETAGTGPKTLHLSSRVQDTTADVRQLQRATFDRVKARAPPGTPQQQLVTEARSAIEADPQYLKAQEAARKAKADYLNHLASKLGEDAEVNLASWDDLEKSLAALPKEPILKSATPKVLKRFEAEDLVFDADAAKPERMDPKKIRFMQTDCRDLSADGKYTVLKNAEALKSGGLKPEHLPPIRLWRDITGRVWTLDHRRLSAYRLAGLDDVPVEWASKDIVEYELFKMQTKNDGLSIILKTDHGKIEVK
ncbi:hypothetical protein WDW86_01610 [Bdellovibrionota bacterium FG-2]